jgi:hypothetical protein
MAMEARLVAKLADVYLNRLNAPADEGSEPLTPEALVKGPPRK